MTVQDQAGDAVGQAQSAWKALTDSWVQSVDQLLWRAPVLPLDRLDMTKPLELVFEFTGRLLEANHQYVRSLAEASITVGGAAHDYAGSIGEVVRVQATAAQPTAAQPQPGGVVDEAERQVARQVRRVAGEKYDGLVKSELHDKLAERNLPVTGNVDELRQRLIEEDLKASA